MDNSYLFLALFFIVTFLLGRLIERIHVPWIFASLFVGGFLAFNNPFQEVTSSEKFSFLSDIGMYMLLFMIGFKLDLNELKQKGKLIVTTTISTIFLTIAVVGAFIHFYFNLDWGVSLIVATSFATVGEAILVPILDELKLVNTRFGQIIIGVGTLDDILEVGSLILLSFLMESETTYENSYYEIIFSMVGLFVVFMIFYFSKNQLKKFLYLNVDSLFFLSLFVLFLFLGIGEYADATAIGALLAGMALSNFIPKEKLANIDTVVKAVTYGFFAPIFFLSIGLEMDASFLTQNIGLIIVFWFLSLMAKIIASVLTTKKELGIHHSILLGVGLSVRFSTSLVLVKMLLDAGLITSSLFSVIIATSIIFKFFVPFTFALLSNKWKDKLIEEKV